MLDFAGLLSKTLTFFLTYTNYIHPVIGCFHRCFLPQQVCLKRSRKCVQDRNKGSHLQPMSPGLGGGPGRHPGPAEDRLPSPFSRVCSSRQESVLHHSSIVILWARGWKLRADPWCGGCPAGVIQQQSNDSPRNCAKHGTAWWDLPSTK